MIWINLGQKGMSIGRYYSFGRGRAWVVYFEEIVIKHCLSVEELSQSFQCAPDRLNSRLYSKLNKLEIPGSGKRTKQKARIQYVDPPTKGTKDK